MKPCCFCSLKTGCYVIGIIEIICWSIVLIITSLTIGLILTSSSHPHHNETNQPFIIDQEIDSDSDYPELGDDIPDLATVYIIFILLIILSIIRISVSILLLLGVYKNSLILVKTWLAIKIMVLLCSLALFLYSLIKYRHMGQTALDFVAILFDIYLIYVVYSLILEMKRDLRGPIPFPKARVNNNGKGVGLHEKENQ